MRSPPEKKEPAELSGAVEGAGLVARFRQRLFPANTAAASSTALTLPPKRGSSLRAGLAELLLITRLKARSHGNQASDILERAAHIVFVTCKNWFAAPAGNVPPPRKRM